MEELKPCPFCGGEAEYYTYEQEHNLYDSNTLGFLETHKTTEHCVGCEERLAMVGPFVTKKQAIKSWNTRAERTCRNLSEFQDCDCLTCSNCGESHEIKRLEYDDDYYYSLDGAVKECNYDRCDCDVYYCPHCGAKVINDGN